MMLTLPPESVRRLRRAKGSGPPPPPAAPERGDGGEGTTARAIIAEAVETQLELHQHRQQVFLDAFAEAFGRPSVPAGQHGIDIEAAIRTAWDAFTEQRFRLVVDHRSLVSLDERVVLHDDSRVVFLRHIELSGA